MDERPIQTRPDTKKIKVLTRAAPHPARRGEEIPLEFFSNRISPGETLFRNAREFPLLQFPFFFNLLTKRAAATD